MVPGLGQNSLTAGHTPVGHDATAPVGIRHRRSGHDQPGPRARIRTNYSGSPILGKELAQTVPLRLVQSRV